MIEPIHPGLIFIIGALIFPLIKNVRLKQMYLLVLPILAFVNLYNIQNGTYWTYQLMDFTITLGRIDPLSKVFGYVFTIFSFCAILYAINEKKDGHQVAAFMYVGSTLGVVFAGDLITLYVFWEIMAVGSAVLIFYQRTSAAIGAGMRYILVHVTGGIFLLGGIVMYINANVNAGMDLTQTIAFNHFDFAIPGTMFILVGFLINAAVPPLHAWLPDAYPEATITGAVFLVAFTTKSAVYVLLRGFSGLEILIWLGAIMAVYGVIYAILENDIRRMLAYSIISQVGYMVAGVGMGTLLAINGSAAHAFSHILYKGLLFMGAGAVILMTGKRKLTELGGLHKTMPMTFALYMVGALSISAFPLFSGFISKSMLISSAGHEHLTIVWLMLTLTSAGTFLYTGLKLPYFTFFGKDAGIEAKDPPFNMLLAMGFVALLNILLGLRPQLLYNLLPNQPVEYIPYTGSHIVESMQLLMFTALGFFILRNKLVIEPTISLDTDWFYRKGGKVFMWFIKGPLSKGSELLMVPLLVLKDFLVWFSKNPKLAIFLGIGIMEYRLLGRIHGLSPEESLEFISQKKTKYPGKSLKRDPVGDAVIVTLIFLFIYVLYFLL